MGDDDLVARVEEAFLEELPGLIAALRRGLESRDATDVGLQAHAIKGTAANVCAEALREVALNLETAGKKGELGPTPELLIDELESQFELVRAQMLSAS